MKTSELGRRRPAQGERMMHAAAPRPRWVTVLAVVNIIWLVVGLLMVASGTWLAIPGMLLLPQTLLAMRLPLLFWGLCAAALALVVILTFARGTPGDRGYAFWKHGTVVLFVSLTAGGAVSFVVLASSDLVR